MAPTLLAGLLLVPAAPLDLDPEELQTGLVAEYRSLVDPKATVLRVEPKPAFTLGTSSPHPRLPPGPFEVTWNGLLSIRDPGPLSFSAFVGGMVTITVDGVVVLDGRGPTETSRVVGAKPLTRDRGYYTLSIRYRS